jgi:LPXTG-motif cell wall-anchored protein
MRRIGTTVAMAVALLVSLTGSAEAAAGPGPSLCEQALPAATDGLLTIDTATVQAGTSGLGVLTDFQQWPAGLVGGGSGETFVSCIPWSPLGEAEVMASEDAGLFLFEVPAGTAPGDHPVSVVFLEGSQQPSGDGTLVRLSTTVTVTSAPATGLGESPACALAGAAATVGELAGDDVVAPGGALSLELTGVPAGVLSRINEYDQLWHVACLGGAATPVLQDDTPPSTFALAVPAGLPLGEHTVRLYGVLGDEVVWWERVITVSDATAPTEGTVTVTQPTCASVTVAGSGWSPTEATVELAVPPSEGGEGRADLVAGPVQVFPDAGGDIPATELRFTSPPRDGRYAAVVLVDGLVRGQSSGFELTGCRSTLPATGTPAIPLLAVGVALLGAGLLVRQRSLRRPLG